MTNDMVLHTGSMLAPMGTVQDFLQVYQIKKDIIESILREGVDFGTIPGTNKPTLYKSGSEKMVSFYGLHPVFEDVEIVEDWMGADHAGEPFFYYRQRCQLWKQVDGEKVLIASADGSCNSWEKKYRYRWVSEFELPVHLDKNTLKSQGGRNSEFTFAIDKAETGGKYGKPVEYWKTWKDAITSGRAVPIKRKTAKGSMMDAYEMDMTVYAIPNQDISEQINTILKMAQKRALIAATLIATNTSDYFTQDVEDFIISTVVEEHSEPVTEVKKVAPGSLTVDAVKAYWLTEAQKVGMLKNHSDGIGMALLKSVLGETYAHISDEGTHLGDAKQIGTAKIMNWKPG